MATKNIQIQNVNPSNLLVNFKYPLSQVQKSTNSNVDTRTKDKVWYSNPRGSSDPTWEILKISLRKPLVINHLSFFLLTLPSTYQVWAISQSGDRSQVLTTDQVPFVGTVNEIAPLAKASWVKIEKDINPIIITQLEFRIKRVATSNITSLFSLGVKELLMQRIIHTQDDTLYSLQPSIDSLGNYQRVEVRDWRPELAIDNNAYTFWKSGPQPSPNAVVNFYCSLGVDEFSSTKVDRVWIDPVYTGNTLNIYYSNDDTVGVLHPRSTKIQSSQITTQNVSFTAQGMDLSSSTSAFNFYSSTLVSSSGLASSSRFGRFGWLGVEFEVGPSFGISSTVNILNCSGLNLTYDKTAQKFTAQLQNPISGAAGISVQSNVITNYQGARYQIIIETTQSSVDPTKVDLRLLVGLSQSLVSDTQTFATLGGTSSYGLENIYQDHTADGGSMGGISITGPVGYYRALILKVQPESTLVYNSFIAGPISFLTPAIRTFSKILNTNPLDNAIYVGNFLDGVYGYGGLGEDFFEQKMWSPIWKDWISQRGYLYFPTPVVAKYLKLEFSSLTPQPYPIYENGIKRYYKTFPVQSTISSNSGIYNQKNISSNTPQGSLQRPPTSGNNVALSSIISRRLAERSTVVLSSRDFSGIRNSNLAQSSIIKTESISAYSKQATNYVSAQDIVSAIVSNIISANSSVNKSLPNNTVVAINNKMVNTASPSSLADSTTSGSLGSRIPGWWVLPGGQLKISESVMNNITYSSIDTEKPTSGSATTTTRTRFPIASVHQYDIKYATQDVALAYFAGLRGFGAFSANYTVPTDSESYVLSAYKGNVDSSSNMTLADVGINNNISATTPTAAPALNVPAYLNVTTWPSVGTYIKVAMRTTDRGLISTTKGNAVLPVGINSTNSGFWDSALVQWGDTVVSWGTSLALVGLGFNSNVYYSGKQSTQVSRQAGVGTAGVSTIPFSLIAGSRVRLCANIFKTQITSNNISIQLVDATPITGTVLGEYPVNVSIGGWQEFKSEFITVGSQIRVVPNITTTSGSATISGVAGSFRSYNVGQTVTGAGIPASTTIISVANDFASAVMSNNATATSSTVSVTFSAINYQELQIRLIINGSSAETLYLADLYDSFTSVVYLLSNNNGVSWYEATSIINKSNSYLVFPTPGNNLKVRVQMYSPLDYAYGFTITPYYLY